MPSLRPLLVADLSFFFLGSTLPLAKFVASPSSIDSSEPLYVSSRASLYLFLVGCLLCRQLLACLIVPPLSLWSPARFLCFLCFFSTRSASSATRAHAPGPAQLLVHRRSLPRVELLLMPERTHAHDSGKKLPLARTQPRQFPHPRR